jgi:hypothetical protein
VNYDEVEDVVAPEEVKAPKKKFTNFLKRREKYDPRKAALATPASLKKTESINEIEERREALDEKPLKPPQTSRMEFSPDEPEVKERPKVDEDKSPKPFLKRRSQAIKPQKVNWKRAPKIDCWVSESAPKPKPRPRFSQLPSSRPAKQVPKLKEFGELRIMHVDELEAHFNEFLANHESVNAFFSRPGRQETTRVPQFKPPSYFITHFTEDIYQETLDALEQHFDFLCNEEVFA